MKKQILFIITIFSMISAYSQTWQTYVYDSSNTVLKTSDIKSIGYNNGGIFCQTSRYITTYKYYFEFYEFNGFSFDSLTYFQNNRKWFYYLKFDKNNILSFIGDESIWKFNTFSWQNYYHSLFRVFCNNYNIRLDINNTFWICGDPYFYNPIVYQIDTNSSTNLYTEIPDSLYLPINCEIESLEIDTIGLIWTANSIDSGIFRFNEPNNQWIKYNHGYKTTHITKDKRGILWFNNTTKGGVLKYDGSSWTSYDTINSCLDKRFYQPHIETYENNLWIVDNDTITGELIIAKIQANQVCVVFDSLGIIAEPRQFVIDSTETLWIASDKGVITFRDTGIYINSCKNNSIELNKLKIYPNPANAQLNIKYQGLEQTSLKEVEIYNCMGALVKVVYFNQNASSVDVSDLPQGFYIVAVQSKGEILARQKIVISR